MVEDRELLPRRGMPEERLAVLSTGQEVRAIGRERDGPRDAAGVRRVQPVDLLSCVDVPDAYAAIGGGCASALPVGGEGGARYLTRMSFQAAQFHLPRQIPQPGCLVVTSEESEPAVGADGETLE